MAKDTFQHDASQAKRLAEAGQAGHGYSFSLKKTG